MGQYRKVMKSIIGTITRLTTIPEIWAAFPASSIAVNTNQNRDMSAFAGSAAKSSGVIRNSAGAAAPNASERITRAASASAELEPAYNLTVDVDECYFVRGEDDRAYLVSNSSHGADAFGLMCVAYETPRGRPEKLKYKAMGIV